MKLGEAVYKSQQKDAGKKDTQQSKVQKIKIKIKKMLLMQILKK